ncbi:hypothetical protein V1477_000951 [Vespula maculifrons]|uniref:Uncharacterized protein n=1 Tax=Vespula maculifrons TaxID=7453 RepID=A0ABD2D0F0_VESMC
MVGTRGASKRTSDVQQRVKLGKAVAAVSPDRPRVAAHRRIAAGITTTTTQQQEPVASPTPRAPCPETGPRVTLYFGPSATLCLNRFRAINP